MKRFDVLFSIFCGLLAADFVGEFYVIENFIFKFLLFILFPILTIFCLWLSEIMGKKFLFVFQLSKHILTGVLATIVDLKFFLFLSWIFPGLYNISSVIIKTFSFIISTIIKYFGNRYWTFGKSENKSIRKEAMQFFIVNVVGLLINIFIFFVMIEFVGKILKIDFYLWEKFSVVISSGISGVWNFTASKFFVFKK